MPTEGSTTPRIASLLPGATEIALALGLRDALVAVSHSCDFPGRVARLPRVTRTSLPLDAPSREIDALVRAALARGESLYQVDGPTLDSLRPDLILTQELCRVCAVGPAEVSQVLPALRSAPAVLSLGPTTLEGVFLAIGEVGAVTGRERRAGRLVAALQRRVDAVRSRRRAGARPRVAFLEWLDPPISGGHWNPELVELAGGVDGLGQPGAPSRAVTWEELRGWCPEVLVVACCGYSAERSRGDLARLRGLPGADDLPCFRNGRVYLLDGKALFSRPGPSLVPSLELLASLL
jgi:iron complex transport system substrate-binding protein